MLTDRVNMGQFLRDPSEAYAPLLDALAYLHVNGEAEVYFVRPRRKKRDNGRVHLDCDNGVSAIASGNQLRAWMHNYIDVHNIRKDDDYSPFYKFDVVFKDRSQAHISVDSQRFIYPDSAIVKGDDSAVERIVREIYDFQPTSVRKLPALALRYYRTIELPYLRTADTSRQTI